jgi:hypothetical protein
MYLLNVPSYLSSVLDYPSLETSDRLYTTNLHTVQKLVLEAQGMGGIPRRTMYEASSIRIQISSLIVNREQEASLFLFEVSFFVEENS